MAGLIKRGKVFMRSITSVVQQKRSSLNTDSLGTQPRRSSGNSSRLFSGDDDNAPYQKTLEDIWKSTCSISRRRQWNVQKVVTYLRGHSAGEPIS